MKVDKDSKLDLEIIQCMFCEKFFLHYVEKATWGERKTFIQFCCLCVLLFAPYLIRIGFLEQ